MEMMTAVLGYIMAFIGGYSPSPSLSFLFTVPSFALFFCFNKALGLGVCAGESALCLA